MESDSYIQQDADPDSYIHQDAELDATPVWKGFLSMVETFTDPCKNDRDMTTTM